MTRAVRQQMQRAAAAALGSQLVAAQDAPFVLVESVALLHAPPNGRPPRCHTRNALGVAVLLEGARGAEDEVSCEKRSQFVWTERAKQKEDETKEVFIYFIQISLRWCHHTGLPTHRRIERKKQEESRPRAGRDRA